MAEGLFDEFADLGSLEEQKKKILAIFGQIKDGLASFKDVGLKIEGAKSVKEFASAQEQYNAYIKDTDRLKKTLLESEKRLYESERKYAELIAANRVELSKRNAELKASAQYEQANTGSIEKARAAIKQLTQERDKLNLFTEEGRKKQEQLNASIDKYNNFIKQSVSLLEQQKMNVGNYAGSLAQPFETLINKLDELKANLKNGIGIGGKTDVESLNKASYAVTVIENALSKSNAEGATSVKQIKNLSNAYRDLSITFGKADGSTNTFLSTLQAQVGAAKDEVADLSDELKLAASDTKGIDNVVGSLNALAGIAQGAAGAYALFGGSQEDAAKVTAKLIAIQGIANSVQQVGQELTKKGTIANKAYEYTLNLVTTATSTNAAATARLNAVLKLSTIGVVVAAVAGLVYIYQQLKKATDEAGQSAKDLADIRAEGLKNAADELTKVRLLYEASQNQNLSLKERKKAVDELQKQYPDYFKNLTDEEILAGKAASAYEQLSKSIIKTGLAQAAKAKITEISSSILEDALKVEEANKRIKLIADGGVVVQDKVQPKTLASGNVVNVAPIRFSTDQKDKDKAISAIKSAYADAFAAVEAGNARIQKIIDGIGAANLLDGIIGDPGKVAESAKSVKKIADNTGADILKSSFLLGKQELEIVIDKNKKIFDDETQTFSDRLDALKAFSAAQMQLIKLEQQFEVDSEKLKLKEIIAGLEEQKKEKGANVKAINDQIAREQEASELRMQVIMGNSYTKMLKAGEDFNSGLKTLKDARQTLREEEKKQIQEFAEWEKKQMDATMDRYNKALAEREAKDKKAYDEKVKLTNEGFKAAEELQNTILFFLTASIDAEIASIDTKARLHDEETKRRINQINLLGLTEQERVKETAKVEKQAQFEREELEKRRRKLLVERAKFEKLANIASIISNTALAVMSVLADKTIQGPFKIAMAAIVGGMGALQLARAVAAPLPQYFKGTDSAKKGHALVSEEGPELMKRNGQLFLTPEKPTLMEMAGGEQITPAHLTRDILNSVMFNKKIQGNGLVLLQPSGISKEQADVMISELKDLKSETARSRTSLTFHFDSNWNTYITKNTR